MKLTLHSIIAILVMDLYVSVLEQLNLLHHDVSIGIFTRFYFIFAFVVTFLYYFLNERFFQYRRRWLQFLAMFVILVLGMFDVISGNPYRCLAFLFSWLLPYFLLPLLPEIRLRRRASSQ